MDVFDRRNNSHANIIKSSLSSQFTLQLHTHTHPFNGPLSGSTRVSRYQKGKTNLDFNGARDSEWQWHQLGDRQVCTSLQTDNHTSTSLLKFFLQTGCPSCRPTNSVRALKASHSNYTDSSSQALVQSLNQCWELALTDWHQTTAEHYSFDAS